MLINFLYQDDIADTNGQSSGWQSGFVTARGTPKPSLRAFMLPLVRASRHGERDDAVGPGAPAQRSAAVPAAGAAVRVVAVARRRQGDAAQRLLPRDGEGRS